MKTTDTTSSTISADDSHVSPAGPSLSSAEKWSLTYVVRLLERRPEVILREKLDLDRLFDGISSRLKSDQMRMLGEDLIAGLNLPDSLRKELQECFENGDYDITYANQNQIRRQFRKLAGILCQYLRVAISNIPDESSPSNLELRLAEIGSALSLSLLEISLIRLLHLTDTSTGFFDDGIDTDFMVNRQKHSRYLPAMIVPEGELAISDLQSAVPALFRFGLVTCDKPEGMHINCDLTNFLQSASGRSFLESYFDQSEASTEIKIPVSVSETEWNLIVAMVRSAQPVNLLFHGTPGTGKTTLARSLCQHLGLRTISVRSEKGGNQSDRLEHLEAALVIAEKCSDVVVLVDEADQLLSTRLGFYFSGNKTDKGAINKLIERSRARVIWISNSIQHVETSLVRRFTYILEFRNLTPRQRRQVWNQALDRFEGARAAFSDDEVETLSEQYPLQAAHIYDTLRRATAMQLPPDQTRALVFSGFDGYLRAEGKQPPHRDQLTAGPRHFDPGILNTDIKLESVTSAVGQFVRYLNDGGACLDVRNMNLLFYGPPGTGKTEFGTQLAKIAGVPLIRKAASDLVSPYIGMTERNIAHAFRSAEDDRAILLIDEADSFLWARENALRSWELSQTNEFLRQMESFRGILICTTNFHDTVDAASLRRFNFKVRFDWLTDAGKMKLFDMYFARLLGWGDTGDSRAAGAAIVSRLRRIGELAPGDFRVVYQRNAFRPEGAVNATELLDELEAESGIKMARIGRTVGFGV